MVVKRHTALTVLDASLQINTMAGRHCCKKKKKKNKTPVPEACGSPPPSPLGAARTPGWGLDG